MKNQSSDKGSSPLKKIITGTDVRRSVFKGKSMVSMVLEQKINAAGV